MSGTGDCDRGRLVDAHFAGTIDPEGERRLRTHLPGCAACRERYERHLALASLDPSAPAPADRLAVGLGLDGGLPARRRSAWWVGAPIVAAAAAAVLLLALRGPTDEGFAGRGGHDATPAVRVWRIVDGAARPVADGGVMASADELAFAYENPGGRAHLLVFGVDERGGVYWYHPAWDTAAQSPRAVAIAGGPALHELPAAVRHEIAGDRLWLHAVFTDEPLDVRAVEALVAGLARPDAPLPLPDADQRTLSLRVRRDGGGR